MNLRPDLGDSDADDGRALTVAARNGCEQAIQRLLKRYRPYLLKIAGAELPQDLQMKLGASDLVQETMLQAAQSIHGFAGDSEAEFVAWLRRILLNRLLNVIRHYRAAKRRTDLECEADALDMPENGPSPSSLVIAQEQQDLVTLALSGMSDRHRRVILLRHKELLSFTEIGTEMGISEAAARKLWARAVLSLKEELRGRV